MRFDPQAIDPDRRPTVNLGGRYIRDIVDDLWAAVAEFNRDPFLFRRGPVVVQLIEADAVGVTISDVGIGRLKHFLERIVNPVDTNGPTGLPQHIVADIFNDPQPRVPPIHGIIAAPIFSREGVLVARREYQPETGYYLDLPKGLVIPDVPDDPKDTDLARAVGLLRTGLMGEFPFVNQSSRAHAVEALLLPFAKPMITGPSPLHMFEAPSAGTGKGLLVKVIGIVTLGRDPAFTTEAHSEDEWRKRITAQAKRAPQMVVIDNVSGRLDSASLSAALTSTVWSDRILGHSNIVELPIDWVWMATANNPAMSQEIARRTVQIRLDSGEPRPWERDGFRYPNLEEWARNVRGDLIWSALTIIQAWIAAGRPAGTAVLGSFESWSSIMGGILGVAGINGFLQGRDTLYAETDREIVEWTGLVTLWSERFGDKTVIANDLLELAKERSILGELWADRERQSAKTSFGRKLSAMRDRVFGSHRIVRTGTSRMGVAEYRLVKRNSAGRAGPGGAS